MACFVACLIVRGVEAVLGSAVMNLELGNRQEECIGNRRNEYDAGLRVRDYASYLRPFSRALAGYVGAKLASGPITEWQIDIIKENISHYCEATIDHSQLSYQEKEEQKRQMKQSLEVYIQGVKDEMRVKMRMM